MTLLSVWHPNIARDAANSMAVLLWGIAMILMAQSLHAQAPPTPKSLHWKLERLDAGEIRWTGELPAAESRMLVQWEAEAVWTSACDPATTRLLARTGRLLTEYRPRHAVPLSTLGAPPGPGTIAFRFHQPRDLTLRAWATVDPPPAPPGRAERLIETLREDFHQAVDRGVNRPETEALLTIGSHYLSLADKHPELGERWRRWLCWALEHEIGALRAMVPHPSSEVDLPLGRLKWEDERLTAGVRVADVERWHPVVLVGLAGEFAPDDMSSVKSLGFNLIAPREASAALRKAAQQWNIALLEELPEAVPVRRLQAHEPLLAGHAVQIVEGWEPFLSMKEQPLADHPERLWDAARNAHRIQIGLAPRHDVHEGEQLRLP